jgi:aspartate racemase
MKKIGIVGGVAWQSTVEYYSELCRRSEQWHTARNPDDIPTFPEITIESLDLAKAVAYLGRDNDEQSWSRFDDYHRSALKRLEASGSDFALMASNTPHHRFENIVRGIQIPVISIVDEMAKESVRVRARRVLLLGTEQTMTSPQFRAVFARHGVPAAGPQNELARSLTVDLIWDLQQGHTEGAAERLSRIAKLSCEAQPGSTQQVVCLACTELPLAFQGMKRLLTFEYDHILYMNSSMVHVNAAFKRAID